MLTSRAQAPQRAYRLLSRAPHPSTSILFPHTTPQTRPPTHTPIRHATHAAQGRANIQNKSAGKRLGAKKTGEQYVIPGNIIYRQRGTLWHAGENVARGRDHTIYATQAGYVKYYKDPRAHKKRQYIGVTFSREETLPYPLNAARRRRFGMVACPRTVDGMGVGGGKSDGGVDVTHNPTGNGISVAQPAVESSPTGAAPVQPLSGKTKAERQRAATGRVDSASLTMQQSYAYRESNWSIGRIAERAGVEIPQFRPGNRWAAWRRREKKTEKYKESRLSARAGKGDRRRAGKRR